MVVFWAENVVIGILAILRMAIVARWMGLFLVPFFSFHYGMFCFGHGVFIFALFAQDIGIADAARVILPGVGALFVSHGASFVMNFLRGGERALYGPADANKIMLAPYRRIIVLHVTIILGGFLIAFLGAPVWALVMLVVLKTGVDLGAHVKERKRAAPTT